MALTREELCMVSTSNTTQRPGSRWHRGLGLLRATATLAGLAALSGCYTVNSFVDAPDANPGDGICARALTPAEESAGRAAPQLTLTPAQQKQRTQALAQLGPQQRDQLARGNLSSVQGPQMAVARATARAYLESAQSARTIPTAPTAPAARNAAVRTSPPARPARPGDFTQGDTPLCTLRAAIQEANAMPLKSFIVVPAGTYNLTLPHTEGGGMLTIERSMRIQGSGAGTTTVDGQAQGIVFFVDGPAANDVEINNLTIQNGNSQAGGGIYVYDGSAELEDLIIQDNYAFTGGGGLALGTQGHATVRRSTFSRNSATGAFGGGIWNAGTLWVHDSTISDNESNRAGGIHNSGDMNLRNVTVTGNWAHSDDLQGSGAGVGGIRQWGFAVLNNVTVTNNQGIGTDPAYDQGGGIQTSASGTTVMKNSIVADNDGQGGPNDCVGELSGDSRNNLIGDSNGCVITSHLNTYVLDQPADLGYLSLHGGPTASHVPGIGSPARDNGFLFPMPAADGCEPRDQRGVPRPQGARCDMGAVEYTDTYVNVSGFMLVDAATNTDIRPLLNDDWLVLSQLPPQLSVRATVYGTPGSVVFGYNGNPNYRTENAAPYALSGDNNGDYAVQPLVGGEHTLTATPYTGAAGAGAAGPGRSIRFNVLQVN
jgi:hypothetical protein